MPRFNRAGALRRVDLNGTPYVEEIAYNARGQRILIAYGNGIMTRYAFDEKSFQLVRLRSEKFQKSSTETTTTYSPDGGKLQDLFYTFDAVGNVQTIESKGEGLGVNPNEYGFLAPEKWGQFTANSLLRLFEYDPLYRVTTATGRERKALEPVPWGNQIPGGSGFEEARPYFESYEYDKAGNLTEKKHEYPQALIGGTATWKRTYTQEPGSNRMVSMGLGSESYAYQYDPGGNLVQENTERHYEWDHADQMKAFRVQPTGSPASKYGAYAYDGGGQRVLKVSIQGSVPHSTVYIDRIFEHHRIHLEGEEIEENNDLHIMDDASRVAIHRIGPDIFSTDKPALQYQLGDHLGSSNVVVDGSGDLINREEYRPYGESSFGSFAKKRYRFTGKERDEESGLYYHSARYYAPWLCRWTAPDPAGMVDGPNLYAYVRGNPVRLVDPSGLEGEPRTLELSNDDQANQQTRTLEFRRSDDTLQVTQLRSRDINQSQLDPMLEHAERANKIEREAVGLLGPNGEVIPLAENLHDRWLEETFAGSNLPEDVYFRTAAPAPMTVLGLLGEDRSSLYPLPITRPGSGGPIRDLRLRDLRTGRPPNSPILRGSYHSHHPEHGQPHPSYVDIQMIIQTLQTSQAQAGIESTLAAESVAAHYVITESFIYLLEPTANAFTIANQPIDTDIASAISSRYQQLLNLHQDTEGAVYALAAEYGINIFRATNSDAFRGLDLMRTFMQIN